MIRKLEEISTLILVLGIILLLPPIILIFNKPVLIFGMPLTAVYIFSVWMILIIGSIWVSRRLPKNLDKNA